MNIENNTSVETLLSFINQKDEFKKTHPLRLLLWEPSLKCNLECLHCSDNCSPKFSRNSDLSTDEIKKVLLDIANAYDASNITFIATGGEPLLRDDLFEVMDYARSLGFKCSMTTNAMLLTKEIALKLKERNISVAVSLDGLEREHNMLRGSSVSFKKAIDGIDNLKKVGLGSRTTIISCVNSLNIGSLEEFIKFTENLNVYKVRLTPIFFEGRALLHKELNLSSKELKKLLDFIAYYRANINKINLSLNDDGYYGPEYECKVRDYFHHCAAGIEWAGILHDGAVVGATHISRDYIEGNVREESFIDIWENRFYQYREGRKELFAPYCKDCEHWDLCEGGGFHMISRYKYGIDKCAYFKLKEGEKDG